LITRFRESYSSVNMSRESRLSQIEEIKQRLVRLSEKCNFCVFSFCQVVQKRKLFEVA